MTLPAVVKTWEFDENKVVGDASEVATNRSQMLEMKNSMIDGGTFTTPWTVIGSSDSSSSNMTGTDLWSILTDIVATNTLNNPHSWIVLEQPGIQFAGAANPLQVLFTMNGGTFAEPLTWRSIVISPRDGFGVANGGTDGSASLDPTATDQWAPMWRQGWLGGGVFGGLVQTVMMSSDGTITRIIIGTGTAARRWLSFETPRDPIPEWDTPFVYMSKGAGDFARVNEWGLGTTDLGAGDNGARIVHNNPAPAGRGSFDPAGYARQGRARIGTIISVGAELVRRTATKIVHDITGGFAITPAVIQLDEPSDGSNAGMYGIWGELEDFYFIGENTSAQDSLPSTGEKTWWCLGDIIVPGLNDSATDIDL